MEKLTGRLTEVTSLSGQFSNAPSVKVTVTDDGDGNITFDGVSINNDNGNVDVVI